MTVDKKRIKECFEMVIVSDYPDADFRYNDNADFYLCCEIDMYYQMFKKGYLSCNCDYYTQKDGE
jgi:hypothetical protein